MAGMITNGYLLVADRIERLNRAGLEYLQISIDNVKPDEVSKKSLKVLDQKLQLLAEHAEFQVNINSVLGSGVADPEDALTVAHRAVELGFTSTVGIHARSATASSKPLGHARAGNLRGDHVARKSDRSRASMVSSTTSPQAGKTIGAAAPARAISTSAKTVWCTSARSSAAIPASRSLNIPSEQRQREFLTKKGCAPRCTVSCVHQISALDTWRGPQTIDSGPAASAQGLVQLTGSTSRD